MLNTIFLLIKFALFYYLFYICEVFFIDLDILLNHFRGW